MLEMLRRKWVKQLGGGNAVSLVIDTKPIPVVGYRRSKRSSDFHGSADYGYCAARKMKDFGYKLVMLSTLEGLPIAYDLVPANTDEREAVETVLEVVRGCDIYGDKGFIGQDWPEQMTESTGKGGAKKIRYQPSWLIFLSQQSSVRFQDWYLISRQNPNRIWTIHRCNQHHQDSSNLKRLISRVRQRIEGVFHEIQNTGRNPERLLNKTVVGFATHMAAKITSHTLRLLLRRQFGIDVQTFQSVSTR